MSISSRVLVGALLGNLAIAVFTSGLGACSDDPESPLAVPDADVPDVRVEPRESASEDDGTAPDDAATDADDDGADAPVLTNTSAWAAASGLLPSAACTPWTLVDTSGARNPVIAGGLLTLATDSNGENMYYIQHAADLIEPATIVVEATVRIVSGTSSNASRAPANIVVRYGNPLRTASLQFAVGEVFVITADLVKGPAAAVATSDAAHTYRFEVDTTTHAMSVSRDGSPLLTSTAYLETDSAVRASIYFGEASNLATGANEWTSVTHNAHRFTACP